MSNLQVEEYKSFEEIKKIREDGTEYWNAREFCEILQYKKWENFAKVIDMAKLACKNSGFEIQDHFPEVRKMVEIGSNTLRELLDCELLRCACYLIVQNSDSRIVINKPLFNFFNIFSKSRKLFCLICGNFLFTCSSNSSN